jgi:hypothetical protein
MRVLAPLLAAFLVVGLPVFASFTGCGGSVKNNGNPAPDAGSTDDGGGDAADDVGMMEAAPVDAPPDVDHGMVSNQYPAPHPPLPQIQDNGGPTLASPRVWLIFYNYQNNPYPFEAQVKQYAQELAASQTYWPAATMEYGVGPLLYGGFTEITDEAPPTTITSQQVDTWIQQRVASNTLGGAPDPHTIYTIVYPSSTTITMMSGFGGGQSCTSFGGYHDDTMVSGMDIPYAVIPTCNNFDGLSGVNAVTGPISHEWIEASTDPYPQNNPAYTGVDPDHFIWELTGGGGEDGDLCVSEPDAFFQPAELAADGGALFSSQRTWSNILAKASHDPCAPNFPNQAYFNSAPVLNENVTLSFGGGINTKGVTIPVGMSKTIEVDLFSDAATSGPWHVMAQDAFAQAMMTAPTLSFSWDKTSGQNGEKLYLTVTVKKKSQYGASAFLIVSQLGLRYTLWPGLVIEQ